MFSKVAGYYLNRMVELSNSSELDWIGISALKLSITSSTMFRFEGNEKPAQSQTRETYYLMSVSQIGGGNHFPPDRPSKMKIFFRI